MRPHLNGTTEGYLDNLDRLQSALDLVQRQVSSGVRVGKASDDPAAVASILGAHSQMATVNQSLTNFKELRTELESGDSAIQNAIRLLEQAIGVATESASGDVDADSKMATLESRARTIQQSLVDLSRTAVSGRHIFSGDLDQQPLYEIDDTQPNGVRQLGDATSTRTVTDDGGATLWISRTAQEIFDARNPDDTNASGNVFAAINDLIKALHNRDKAAAALAVDRLKAADEHLNGQLGLYGIAETRLTEAANSAEQSLVTQETRLSDLRDTDVAGAAIELSQLTLQQQAALSARAKVSQLSLFDFLA